MVFLEVQLSSKAHFLKMTGHLGEVLGSTDPGPHRTHIGAHLLVQLVDMWLLLEWLAHLTTPAQALQI